MSIIAPQRRLVHQEAVQFRAGVSEDVGTRLGANLNLHALRQYDVKEFRLNGQYTLVTGPQTDVDGFYIFPFDCEIIQVGYYHGVAGSGGTTELDIKIASTSGGPFSSIFSTTPKIQASAGNDVFALAYAITENTLGQVWAAASQPSGVTGAVLSGGAPFLVNAGQAIRLDILSKQTGNPQQTGILIYFRPR